MMLVVNWCSYLIGKDEWNLGIIFGVVANVLDELVHRSDASAPWLWVEVNYTLVDTIGDLKFGLVSTYRRSFQLAWPWQPWVVSSCRLKSQRLLLSCTAIGLKVRGHRSCPLGTWHPNTGTFYLFLIKKALWTLKAERLAFMLATYHQQGTLGSRLLCRPAESIRLSFNQPTKPVKDERWTPYLDDQVKETFVIVRWSWRVWPDHGLAINSGRQINVLTKWKAQNMFSTWQSESESSCVMRELLLEDQLERVLDVGIYKSYFLFAFVRVAGAGRQHLEDDDTTDDCEETSAP